jgi:Myo-inositol-1-phosphate synthase
VSALSSGPPPSANNRLGVMVAGLGALGTTFIGGVLLIRKGVLQPLGSVTQMEAGWLAADAGVSAANLSVLLGLVALQDLVFGAWSIFPDTAAEVAQVWSLFEPSQLEAVGDDMYAVKPAKAVFNAHEVADGTSGTYIKDEQSKARLADDLNEDLKNFERRYACRSVVLFSGSPEMPLQLSAAHDSVDAFEAALRNNDPSITSSQIYAWVCAKRGTPFACGASTQAIGFPAIEELAEFTGTPLAGNVFRPASYRVLDVAAPVEHALDAQPHCWWPEPLRPEMNLEILHPMIREAAQADREAMPIEEYKRTNPAMLDVALLLDAARRHRFGGTQRWLNIFFSAPIVAQTPEQEVADFRDVLVQMMKDPSAGPRRG